MYQEGLHLQFKTNLSGEVKSLLEKNVKQPVRRQGFYSTFFLVPKKDGRFGPILNLRVLNTYLHEDMPHFKMEILGREV